MTFLSNPAIVKLNQELLSLSATTPKVYGKIESFTINKNSHYKANIPSSYHPISMLSSSPVLPSFNQSACLHATPQHFSALMDAYTTAFPDFDFSTVVPWNFKLISSAEQAQSNINWTFKSALSDCDQLMGHLWTVLDKEIYPSASYIYMYESDKPDAFTEMGAVFNLSYFFLNDKMNKIVLVHLREGANEFGSDFDDADNMEEDNENLYGSIF